MVGSFVRFAGFFLAVTLTSCCGSPPLLDAPPPARPLPAGEPADADPELLRLLDADRGAALRLALTSRALWRAWARALVEAGAWQQ